MSLQRVLEIARKRGMPVIMTDLAGREPMVIMPLEQFEAMSGFESKIPSKTTDYRSRAAGPRYAGLQTTASESVDQALAEMTAERLKNRMEEAAMQLEDLADQGDENTEIPLEERFYLEPVEDKNEM